VTAHALGSGIYRPDHKLVQHPDDPTLWLEIGYEKESGDLELGKSVVLKRSRESSPEFFEQYITPQDAIQLKSFQSDEEQLAACADAILENIATDELYAHDIVVIFPDAIKAAGRGNIMMRLLSDRNIRSHVAGVTSSRDTFIKEGQVTISGPFRAKGNEAPMVYLLDADHCVSGIELIKRRNTLFTAITRSRAWARVFGVGAKMELLKEEFRQLVQNDFKLNFTIPTGEELKQIRTQYRDISESERKQVSKLKSQLENIFSKEEEADALIASLPQSIREKLRKSLLDSEEE